LASDVPAAPWPCSSFPFFFFIGPHLGLVPGIYALPWPTSQLSLDGVLYLEWLVSMRTWIVPSSAFPVLLAISTSDSFFVRDHPTIAGFSFKHLTLPLRPVSSTANPLLQRQNPGRHNESKRFQAGLRPGVPPIILDLHAQLLSTYTPPTSAFRYTALTRRHPTFPFYSSQTLPE
jgi:hypothetical protein